MSILNNSFLELERNPISCNFCTIGQDRIWGHKENGFVALHLGFRVVYLENFALENINIGLSKILKLEHVLA